MSWQERYVQRFYRSRPGWRDGTEEFHALCVKSIPPRSRVLELGPGSGGQTSEFLARVAADLVGLDVDEAIQTNPHLAEKHVYDGVRFPFPDQAFGAIVSDYALEHVANPGQLLLEIHRVLKPGGTFIFRTPNKWHYVSLLGRTLPDRVSVWARHHAEDHRVYPRVYRCNTRKECHQLLLQAGLQVEHFAMIEKEPSYGMSSRLLFFPMMVYERLVNSSSLFGPLRANILCVARKPEH